MDISISKIDREFEDMERLYEINEEAFPEDERIPSESLLHVMEQYGCQPYAIYAGAEMIGFTAVVADAELRIGYIWYFAIAKSQRNKGLGSAALQRLQQTFHEYQLVLDMEQVDPQAENYQQRRRRLAFYERNGFIRPMVGMSYLGMDFELMCNRAPLRIADFRALLKKIQNDYWHPILYPLTLP